MWRHITMNIIESFTFHDIFYFLQKYVFYFGVEKVVLSLLSIVLLFVFIKNI